MRNLLRRPPCRDHCRRLLALLCCAGLPAVPSASRAAEPTTRPAGPKDALAGGLVEFARPAGGWDGDKKARTATRAVFVSQAPEGIAFIEVLPPNAETGAATAPAVIKQLRENRRKNDQQVLMDPTVEPDARFALRVHERYQAGERVADVLYLYRRVGPRVVLVRVDARAEGEADVKAVHAAGEALALSAAYVKPPPKKAAGK